jgi:hypothetical protein
LIHDNKYDYSLVEYKNSLTLVNIICSIHGIFKVTPNNHISKKNGCSSCSGYKKKSSKTYINKVKKIHNNKYDYSLLKYNGIKKNISVIPA